MYPEDKRKRRETGDNAGIRTEDARMSEQIWLQDNFTDW